MLSTLARRHRVPGAQVALHVGGQTVAAEFGELEHGGGHPVPPHAAFPIGSIGKVATATVAMVLVADDDLELDAPIAEWLPDLDGSVGRLTVRQLLSHTGGLASSPPDDATCASLRRYVAEECGRRDLIFAPGTFAPGTAFSYSNVGYLLVGRLIEVTTGMTWAEAIESILLRPLGIIPTFVGEWVGGPTGRPVATGHSANVRTGRTRPVAQSLRPAEAPAGGLAMSALDLVTFGLQYVGRTDHTGPLPAMQAAQMRRPQPGVEPFGMADGWGLGLAFFRCPQPWVGHDGNADGTACYLRVDAGSADVVALTSNANTGIGLWIDLQDELKAFDLRLGSTTPRPGRAPMPPPAGCAGVYLNGDLEYVVSSDEGGLCLSVDGDAPERLTFYEGHTFWLDDATTGRLEFGGRFLPEPGTGAITGLQLGGRLAPRRD